MQQLPHLDLTVTVSLPVDLIRSIFSQCLHELFLSQGAAHQLLLPPSSLPAPASEIRILTTKDICRMFKVSKMTISTWRKQGKIPFHKQGRRVYFIESEVMEVLSQSGSGKRKSSRR
jgi:excisionase family DNA binding protein